MLETFATGGDGFGDLLFPFGDGFTCDDGFTVVMVASLVVGRC